MIRAAVIDNGLPYVRSCYRATGAIDFAFMPAHAAHAGNLHERDWVVVPNGCDHVALWRARGAVAAVLERGGALVCGDGWFTDWVPGNRWIHDNAHPPPRCAIESAATVTACCRGSISTISSSVTASAAGGRAATSKPPRAQRCCWKIPGTPGAGTR